MWIFIDKVSWNTDVVLSMGREAFSEYEPVQVHYKHLEDRADRIKALEQVYDIIDKAVNGEKDIPGKPTVQASDEKEE